MSNDSLYTNNAYWMGLALEQTKIAMEKGELPVGAVVVHNGKPLCVAHNEKESLPDPTAHAEILALRRAAKALGTWHLEDCVLYVTLEPCVMCAAAIQQARIGGLVFGAFDTKAGGCGSLYKLTADDRLGARVPVTGGVRKAECTETLATFFANERKKKGEPHGQRTDS